MNRSVATRQVMSCLGSLKFRRRWWGSRCGCEALGYGADRVLGLDRSYTRTLQQHLSRLAADLSFAKAREHLSALLRVSERRSGPPRSQLRTRKLNKMPP